MDAGIRRTLEQLAAGTLDVDAALERLAQLPGEHLPGVAQLDHHRALRTGLPEVVYGDGKRPDEIAAIVDRLKARGHPVLVTRLSPEAHAACRECLDSPTRGDYCALSRTWRWHDGPLPVTGEGLVVVACAGTSDLPVAEEAARTAETFGNPVERVVDVGVAGIHRTLERLDVLRKARVVIVVAGMEGALPSVVAGLVAAPVIAVPTSVGYGASLGGVAALLTMLNSCASGITVVNIDNGFGAAAAATLINHPVRAPDAAHPEARPAP